MRSKEVIATSLLKVLLRTKPLDKVLGTEVTVKELAGLLAEHFTSCPACGTEPWLNIDCKVCATMTGLELETLGVNAEELAERGVEFVQKLKEQQALPEDQRLPAFKKLAERVRFADTPDDEKN